MILEVWVMTTTPGKEDESIDYTKRRTQAHKRQLPSINSRVLRPTTGKMNKKIVVDEFASYDERDRFWNNLSDEIKELIKEMNEKEYWVPGSGERYVYEVVI